MARTVSRFFALVAASGVVLGFAGVVEAALVDEQPARRAVHYSDLNLDRQADAVKLYGRIERAAGHVCRTRAQPHAQIQAALRKCMQESIANAVARVGHPNLTAVHAARTHDEVTISARR
jgi:UrcA family protein